MSEFSNTLRYLRESRGLIQKEVAEALGISPAAYSLYEKGQREPKLDMLEKIADFFMVSLDYLLTGKKGKELNDDINSSSSLQNNVQLPGTITLYVTKENLLKYPKYFNIVLDQVIEMIYNNSNDYYSIETGEKLKDSDIKEIVSSLSNDEKLVLLESVLKKLEVNTMLNTINIFFKAPVSSDSKSN